MISNETSLNKKQHFLCNYEGIFDDFRLLDPDPDPDPIHWIDLCISEWGQRLPQLKINGKWLTKGDSLAFIGLTIRQ